VTRVCRQGRDGLAMGEEQVRIRALLHLEHEGLGLIGDLLWERRLHVEPSKLWCAEPLPRVDDFDFLIVMGGSMNVDEEERYPWLAGEKALIADSVRERKRVLGICLGAQLIARALGASVRPMGYKEIGWYPIHAEFDTHPLFPSVGREKALGVAHWHGDTFDLPKDCDRLFSSEACSEQGFALRGRPVIGLQFHLELREDELLSFIEHGGEELSTGGPWVQAPEETLRFRAREASPAAEVLAALLDGLLGAS